MLAIGLAAGPLHAAPASLTLPEAIRQALEREPELRASSGRVGVARGQAVQAGLWSNPELQFSVEDMPLRDAGWSASKRMAGFSQTVPFPGKKRLEGEIGILGLRLSQAELALRRTETVRNVKRAFFQTLAAESLVKVAGDLAKAAEGLAISARKRVEAGAAPEQEALRAEIPLEKARMELADFQRELFNARKLLATLLGRSELGPTTIIGTLAESADPQWLDRQPAEPLAEHPGKKVAQANVSRAALVLHRARLDIFPDVTVGVGAGREAVTNAAIGEIRFGIPLPIVDSSSGKRQEARANLAVAQAEAEAIALRLSREWSNAAERVRVASAQAQIYRKRVLPKANQALSRMQSGYDEGKFSLVDVIETQRTAAEAQLAYQQKLMELNLAQVDLEALLGWLK